MRHVVLYVTAVLIGGCGSEPDTEEPPPLPCGEHARVDGDGCAASLRVESCDALPQARDHLGTVHVRLDDEDYLMASGGLDFGAVGSEQVRARAEFFVARIEDGRPGPWAEGQLPEGRAGHGIVAHAGRIYLLGGLVDFGDAPGPSADSWTRQVVSGVWAPGSSALTDVREEAPLPEAVWHLQAAMVGEDLVVIGGRTARGVASDMSVRAVFDEDRITGWEASDRPLDAPITHHGLAQQGGRVFLAGGLEGESGLADVLAADPASGFEPTWVLETSRITPATFVIGDVLFVGAGLTDTGATTAVEAFVVGESAGRDWTLDLGELPAAAGHIHQVPVIGDTAFVLGGRTPTASLAQCVTARMQER